MKGRFEKPAPARKSLQAGSEALKRGSRKGAAGSDRAGRPGILTEKLNAVHAGGELGWESEVGS